MHADPGSKIWKDYSLLSFPDSFIFLFTYYMLLITYPRVPGTVVGLGFSLSLNFSATAGGLFLDWGLVVGIFKQGQARL